MPHEIAHLRLANLTFMSRFLAISALIAVIAGGCSSTNDDQSGAAGHGGGVAGAGGGGTGGVSTPGSGGKAGTGGATCGRMEYMHELDGICHPPSTFPCAATYDEQAAVTSCVGLGSQTIVKGVCSTGWAWNCRTDVSDHYCIYDEGKSLVKAQSCFEGPCDISSDVSTDGGHACDISELHGG